MSSFIKYYFRIALIALCTFSFFTAGATHLAGGEMIYKYLGDSTNGWHKYQVSLTIYEDCSNGQPQAIAEDNPAFLGVYLNASPYSFVRADSVFFSLSDTLPGQSLGPCGINPASLCLIKKTFTINYTLSPNASGYTICYQRCCRNNATINIYDPGNNGVTYSCTIPNQNNNSAVFKNYPPEILAINAHFTFDHSATDADGDSLSYELCSALNGAYTTDTKPWPPYAPPFDTIKYLSPYTAINPVHASVAFGIDPVTGALSGTPDLAGLYLITVCCHEWRSGVMINTIRREFQFKVASLPPSGYKPDAGGDVTLVVGDMHRFYATGAATYTWSPATYLDNPNIADPTGHFIDPGTFTYTLRGVTDSGCEGYDVIRVNVLAFSGYMVPAAFTPNGDGKNDVLNAYPLGNSTLQRFKIFNRKGNLVYSAGPQDPGWDGIYHGVHQDTGTYYWELEYTDNNGKTRLIKGNVTLVR